MSTIGYDQADGGGIPLSGRFVERVAQHTGADALTLPPLSDVIDPDAPDALFQGSRMNGQVRFSYHGREVTIHIDGEIELDSYG